MSDKKPAPTTDLRAEAEGRLRCAPPDANEAASRDELLHELQVHRIELEMQNESLRQTQVAMEESRDRYANLYEFSPVAYLTLSADGLITDINLTGTSLLGEDRAKLLRRRFAPFIAPEERNSWHVFFAHALRHGVRNSCETKLTRKDGTVFDVRVDCLSPTDGTPELRIALSDITELKRTLFELRTGEARLTLAKNLAGFGIYDRDYVSGKLDWDEHIREIWGFAPDAPTDLHRIIAGVHPDDRAAVESKLARMRDPHGAGEFDTEFRVINQTDGSVRHVAGRGRTFFQEGRAIRGIGVVRDASTERQQEREEQERRGEMELLLSRQVATQTAAAIAHELNQPLVSISAYSEAALRMLQSGRMKPDKLAHVLEGAMEQAHRAGRTLHELLDFLHKGEASTELVDINAIIREAIAIASESGYGGFCPVIELEPNLRPVRANRLQLQKVVLNILHNAVQAMRDADVPTADITITVRTLSDRNLAQVTLKDSGPGLDAETAHRVFEPIFTTKPEGMGLGLAISRALVEAHGGQLWAELDSGPGATFHFTLPFAS